ncbi:MAG TPA: glucose-6-phosphate isomerase, partial [Sumerlaeia bacterium]|nr:glucose-6-phosphate isomerase [Sumerlaeia bacterium]
MTVRLDYNAALADVVGARHGVSLRSIEALRARAEAIHNELVQRRENGDLGFFDLPYDEVLVAAIKAYARSLKSYENFVLLGIGGSALGPICLHTALAHNYHNLLTPQKRKGFPRLFVLDNSDPEILRRLFDAIDVGKTVFNVVTKSGATPETMAQLMTVVELIKRKVSPKALSRRLIATTDVARGLLRPFADGNQLASFVIPDNVGGRFSVFTAVGLLPAAVEGIPIDRLLAGAREMDQRCRRPDLMKNPAYLNAAIHYLADTKKGKSISVMMPYSNALRDVADWGRQLWAESLGKAVDRQGRRVNVGQTPVKALGATDQHSQMQLYVEGPNDKIVTLIQVEKYRAKCAIPKTFRDVPDLDFLKGRDMGELLNAELEAAEFALAKAKRPSVRIVLDEISPENVGGLLYMLEVQTAFAGGLYNINAFDQPGVEECKKATAALMGRQTPADVRKAAEIAAFREKKKR